MLLISRPQKQLLHVNDNYTHQKGWEIFLEEKLKEKIKEARSGFQVLANKISWSNAVSKVNR